MLFSYYLNSVRKAQLERLFRQLDENHSDTIDLNELVEGCLRWHLYVAQYSTLDYSRIPSRQEIQVVYQRIKDKSGRTQRRSKNEGLDLAEFEECCILLMGDLTIRMAWWTWGKFLIYTIFAPLLWKGVIYLHNLHLKEHKQLHIN